MKFADIELPSNRKFGYFCMFIFGVGDELRLKLSKAQSHWRERSPIGPDAKSLKNQF